MPKTARTTLARGGQPRSSPCHPSRRNHHLGHRRSPSSLAGVPPIHGRAGAPSSAPSRSPLGQPAHGQTPKCQACTHGRHNIKIGTRATGNNATVNATISMGKLIRLETPVSSCSHGHYRGARSETWQHINTAVSLGCCDVRGARPSGQSTGTQ